MEELLKNLEQATNPDPNIQKILSQYINAQLENAEFGNALFTIIQNENSVVLPHILSHCCNLLRLWAKVQWSNLTFDHKSLFFSSLKKMILTFNNSRKLIDDLSIVYIDLISNASDDASRVFESDIFDFFNKISANPPLHQLYALTNIIFHISRKYRRSKSYEANEPSLLLARVINVFPPLFMNNELFQTQEGCDILRMSLSIFKNLFFRVEVNNYNNNKNNKNNIIQKAIIPIQFAQSVLSMFVQRTIVDMKLVTYSCRFLNTFYSHPIFKRTFSEDCGSILNVHFLMLKISLEFARNDTFLMPSILTVLETFRKFIVVTPETLSIILAAAELTPTDHEEFVNSPNIFYLNVYEKFKAYQSSRTAPQIARSLICSIVQADPSLFGFLVSLPQKENVIRCIGYCLKTISDDAQMLLRNVLNEYCEALFMNLRTNHQEMMMNDPLLLTAHLDFMRNYVRFLNFEQKMQLMNILPIYFNINYSINNLLDTKFSDNNNCNSNNCNNENWNNNNNNLKVNNNCDCNDNDICCIYNCSFVVVSLFACRLFECLLKHKIQPFKCAIQFLVGFLPYCFTSVVLDSIRLLVKVHPDCVIPYAETVLEGFFESFNLAFEQFESGEANQIEAATDSITSNLNFYAMLIDSAGSGLVKTDLLDVVRHIFERLITDCDLSRILSAVFGTDSLLIPQFTEIWFHNAVSDGWIGFIDQLLEPFFAIVSKNPLLFIQLKVTEQLEEICLSFLIDPNSPNLNSVFRFGSLMSWIILVDTSFDATPCLQSVQLITSMSSDSLSASNHLFDNGFQLNVDVRLLAALFEVMAALTVARGIVPDQITLTLMIAALKRNFAMKMMQKRLFASFLLQTSVLNRHLGKDLIPLALFLLNEEKSQENAGCEEYFHNQFILPQLCHLVYEEIEFQSPIYTMINIHDLMNHASSVCQNEI